MASVAPLPFCVALANQCFTNDHAYIESSREVELVDRLAKRVCKDIGAKSIDALELCVLASYRALHLLPCSEELSQADWPKGISILIQRHLHEPLCEQKLRKKIPRQSTIGDPVSVAVRDQYEESPYPRWVSVPLSEERTNLAAWLRRNLSGPIPTYVPTGHFDMFVAGCGTGQELVSYAGQFYDVTIDAVDLSIASLASTARKLSEFGLKNVTIAQADILELEAPKRPYDVVVASGVLHHLADPLRGWQKLMDLVKPGGHMFIALYSEIGRQDVSALSRFGRDGKYGTSAAELRRFRADIFARPANDGLRNFAINREDFYSLSMLRDMVFHVNERRFTIDTIASALAALGLEFCGFLVEPELKLEFEKSFGDNSLSSLTAWSRFEAAHPQTFRQMYHLVVRKPLLGAA
jgi:SAM-dependent methyltransferase